jgi:hypothetical protein
MLDSRNPLMGEDALRDPKMLGLRVVRWSGWLGEGTFVRDPATWSPGGWKEFERACVRMGKDAGDARVIIRPHARHVLSDPQRSLTFLRAHERRLGLLLDPFAMLESTMLARVDEHLERAMDALIEHPGVEGVVACNVIERETQDGVSLVPTPIERGLVASDLILKMVRRVPPHMPIVLLDEAFESDAALLDGVGRAGDERDS